MANKDSMGRTLTVAFLLCVVCSVVVSGAAVSLRPLQQANKDLDRKRNILLAAGLYSETETVDTQFAAIETRLVDLDSGRFVESDDPASYDQRKAAKDPSQSRSLDDDEDIAKISRRENRALVYLVQSDGAIDKVILPIHGYGLWSTLYGYIALEENGNDIFGLQFYEHAETPGLGAEVDNPRWKSLWNGKKLADENGQVQISVTKTAPAAGAESHIDALAGATLTTAGVHNLVNFWMGESGYAPFLANLKAGDI